MVFPGGNPVIGKTGVGLVFDKKTKMPYGDISDTLISGTLAYAYQILGPQNNRKICMKIVANISQSLLASERFVYLKVKVYSTSSIVIQILKYNICRYIYL